MRIPRFYQTTALSVGSETTLDARVSHHLTMVLRAEGGMACVLFNGDGFEYHATIVRTHRKHALVMINSQHQPNTESNLKIHWAQCMSASDRMDYTIQKATELGVNEITPILSARMTVKWRKEKAEKKIQHWQNIAISASEQSFRVQVPIVHYPVKFNDFMVEERHETKFILDTESQEEFLKQDLPEKGIIVLVGSESGFSEQELEHAFQSRYKKIGFGPRVLRTETVAPAVLAVVQYLWGDI